MKTISTTNVRKYISDLIDEVRETGEVIAIGRRSEIEVLMMKFPSKFNSRLSDITNVNAYSSSFDFLENEPDIYSVSDLKKRYV
ncbi:MAG: hypothetical protein AAB590_03425 [Patescibacteria group bacterium]